MRIVLGVIVGALVMATVVGLFMLWPGKSSLIGSRSFTAEGGSVGKATITSVDLSSCQSAVSALTEVNGVKEDAFAKGHVCARITEGEGKGLVMPVQLVGEPRKLAHAGDRLVVEIRISYGRLTRHWPGYLHGVGRKRVSGHYQLCIE